MSSSLQSQSRSTTGARRLCWNQRAHASGFTFSPVLQGRHLSPGVHRKQYLFKETKDSAQAFKYRELRDDAWPKERKPAHCRSPQTPTTSFLVGLGSAEAHHHRAAATLRPLGGFTAAGRAHHLPPLHLHRRLSVCFHIPNGI